MKFLLKASLPPPKNGIFEEIFDSLSFFAKKCHFFHKSAIKFSKFFRNLQPYGPYQKSVWKVLNKF
jgi:hypothetical protein